MNRLYYGDNLFIMERMAKYSVDLIYLDPPFKSDQNYNLLYKNFTGRPVPEQAEAFCDTWEMDAEKERLAKAMPVLMREYDVDEYYIDFWRLWMQALRHTQPHLLAYLIYMVRRLLQMKIILKPTGSLYLHCDPTASHYIKVMMDGIFHHSNFRNEIIWKRTSAHSGAKRYGPVHDVLLYYTVSDSFVWNPQYQPYDESYIRSHFGNVSEDGAKYYTGDLTGPGVRDGASGQPWRGFNPTDRGRHWQPASYLYSKFAELTGEDLAAHPFLERLDKLDEADLIYWPKKDNGWPRYKQFLLDREGVPLQDVWTDISPINSQAKNRMGYPTQKPMALLDRIVRSSSNPGQVVFDPFCGCGTTVYAAHEAGRSWIGCDVAILAVKLIERQLDQRYGLVKGEHYTEEGIPNSVASAKALWDQHPGQFEHWVVEAVDGFPNSKKSADRGIDGRIYFDMKDDEIAWMALSVKGGNIRPTDIRDLRGVLSDEPDVYLAGFITMQEPSKKMREAAAEAGMWEYQGHAYERVQILTVKEIVEDKKRFNTPTKIGMKHKLEQALLPL
ncbi:MAG: site-specific DNA-methyltransferase [Gemmatimonadota bacterium]|nr:site-specific DNA-methyltransferase [Gemmatimonadota bacterium]